MLDATNIKGQIMDVRDAGVEWYCSEWGIERGRKEARLAQEARKRFIRMDGAPESVLSVCDHPVDRLEGIEVEEHPMSDFVRKALSSSDVRVAGVALHYLAGFPVVKISKNLLLDRNTVIRIIHRLS